MCDLRAQNRLGLQLYPLQIARVMNSLHTGTYKLHSPLIVIPSAFRPTYSEKKAEPDFLKLQMNASY